MRFLADRPTVQRCRAAHGFLPVLTHFQGETPHPKPFAGLITAFSTISADRNYFAKAPKTVQYDFSSSTVASAFCLSYSLGDETTSLP
jgi:hypothetical protein